jgi:DNA-binding transcriptional LysR family regulator
MKRPARHNYRDRRHVRKCVDVTERAVQRSAGADLSHLSGYACLQTAITVWRNQRCAGTGEIGEVTTEEFVRVMVTNSLIAGLGVTKLPENVVRADLAAGKLERVLPQWNAPLGIVHLVFPTRRGLLPAVRALIDFLAVKLPSAIGQ